jgi:hypothetical protein
VVRHKSWKTKQWRCEVRFFCLSKLQPRATASQEGRVVAEQIAYVLLNGCICDSSSFSFHTQLSISLSRDPLCLGCRLVLFVASPGRV